MKSIMIRQYTPKDNDFEELTSIDNFSAIMNDYQILESNIIYFSAGDSKIKEILIRREPFVSL